MRALTRTGNYISSRIGRAIGDYKLIEDRDRILVAVSGGKDESAAAAFQGKADNRKAALLRRRRVYAKVRHGIRVSVPGMPVPEFANFQKARYEKVYKEGREGLRSREDQFIQEHVEDKYGVPAGLTRLREIPHL